jgi:hypothetical protein
LVIAGTSSLPAYTARNQLGSGRVRARADPTGRSKNHRWPCQVEEATGSGANDVGWERQADGTYRAWISEFDAGVGPFAHRRESARFNPAMQDRVKQEYAYQIIERQQRARGRSVSRQRLPSGEIEVLIEGYR